MAEEKLEFGEEFDQQQEFTLIDDGEYECLLEKIEKRTSKTGKECLNFTFVIRKDVEQKFQGRKVFYSLTKKADDTKGIYDFNRVNKLILTQKERQDYKKNFGDADEVFQYLNGIHLILEIKTEYDEFSGKDRNVVVDFSFKPSVWDKTEHNKDQNLDKVQVADSDLPW